MINADNHGDQDSVHWWYLFIIKLIWYYQGTVKMFVCLLRFFNRWWWCWCWCCCWSLKDDDVNKEKLQATEQVAWAFLQTSGSLAQVRMRIFIFLNFDNFLMIFFIWAIFNDIDISEFSILSIFTRTGPCSGLNELEEEYDCKDIIMIIIIFIIIILKMSYFWKFSDSTIFPPYIMPSGTYMQEE